MPPETQSRPDESARASAGAAHRLRGGLRDKRLIALEELRDIFGFGYLRWETLGRHYGSIVLLMGLAKVWRHRQVVIEVRERRIGILDAVHG